MSANNHSIQRRTRVRRVPLVKFFESPSPLSLRYLRLPSLLLRKKKDIYALSLLPPRVHSQKMRKRVFALSLSSRVYSLFQFSQNFISTLESLQVHFLFSFSQEFQGVSSSELVAILGERRNSKRIKRGVNS